jgi:GNAT superfamily N-acetyltransferase
MSELRFVPPGSPLVDTARRLFRDYADELGVDLCFQGFDQELEELPGKYTLPKGALLVALDSEQPVACAAFRPWDTDTCELKRFYVAPEHRGQGIAAELLMKLVVQARKAGYRRAILDSLERLGTALRFYERHGFERTEAYYDNPEPDVVFMARSIRPAGSDALQPFLDHDGRLNKLPAGKGATSLLDEFLERLVEQFERGRDYSEREVNAIIDSRHTFGDRAILRRSLIDRKDLERTPDTTRYWRP